MLRRELLFPAEEINAKVRVLAQHINDDYADDEVLLLVILKGAVIFAADLIREIHIAMFVDFVSVSSYGKGMCSAERIRFDYIPKMNLKGRHVIIIEDIVDTGLTVHALRKRLGRRKPASIRICALLNKSARRKAPVDVDYKGFDVGNYFVVGYGMDYDERHRNLPDIHRVICE